LRFPRALKTGTVPSAGCGDGDDGEREDCGAESEAGGGGRAGGDGGGAVGGNWGRAVGGGNGRV